MGYHKIERTYKNRKTGKEYIWHTLKFKVENIHDWLLTYGGRNMNDVLKDDKGLYVEMTTYDGSNKVYIPNRFCTKKEDVISSFPVTY